MKNHKYKIEIDTRALERDIKIFQEAVKKLNEAARNTPAMKKAKKKMDRSIERTGEPFPGSNKFIKLFKAKKSLLAVAWTYYPYVRKS